MNTLSAHELNSCEVAQREELDDLVRLHSKGFWNNDRLIVVLASSHKRHSWDCVRLL